MRRSHLSLLLAALAVTASAGCGGGATDSAASSEASSSASAPAAQASGQDRAWMRKIHMGGLAEIHAARLAQDKGSTEVVKSLGGTFVKDYDSLDDQLVHAAERHGVHLPAELSTAEQKKAAALEEAARARFDSRFLKATAQAHKQAITATKREIKKGSAPEIVSLARTTLPSLESHMAMLREVDGS
ncbi:DUF4142 domain-containing protein [Nonomuraea sp. 3-1Str]|uniref:DUF4142 domain-containing protein n=1 Tax=Nonomuraea sp. 3-1Str TaxID=2929801 RepID=UPI002870946A|nr:DUF4142 domain-containing protein [Nonomuraea sp. 3-1Str]